MELTKEEMLRQIELHNKLQQNIKEYCQINKEILNYKSDNYTWRDIDMKFWETICLHYPENELLNCYGDIFHIESRKKEFYNEIVYIGKRVLWNLKLSEEQYKITEFAIEDEDGMFEYNDYNIEVIADEPKR